MLQMYRQSHAGKDVPEKVPSKETNFI
jgi:hypothetical protein